MKKLVFPIAVMAMMFMGSCSKKDNATQVQANSNTNSTSKIISAQTGFPSLSLMAKMRKVTGTGQSTTCIDETESCHPEDIVITAPKVYELMNAIRGGGAGVAQLFSNNEKATGLIPDWNAEWFADVKTAILSGNYTFLQAGESVFLLGREGAISENNFDYAIKYYIR